MHRPSGVSAISTEFRSQERNRKAALGRLRHKIVLHQREEICSADWPDPKVVEVSRRSEQYILAIGKILDVLEHVGWSVSDAAKIIGISTGRLVSFLAADDPLFAELNRRRKSKGLRGLNS
jgi:ribulose kinase